MRSKDERLEQIDYRLEEIDTEMWELENGYQYMDMASRVAALEDERQALKMEHDQILESE